MRNGRTHLVVLVLDDLAVPHELPGSGEGGANSRDLAGKRGHGVLPAGLPRLGQRDHAIELERFEQVAVGIRCEALAVGDLEHHGVHGIGWASAVVLWNSHTSVAPTAGFSVTGSTHIRSTATLFVTVPSSASTGPSAIMPPASTPIPIFSMSASGRTNVSGGPCRAG